VPSEGGYYQKLVSAFHQLIPKVITIDHCATLPSLPLSPQPLPSSLRTVVKLDGANGVGADKVRRLMEHFTASGGDQTLTVQVVNDGSSGVLNYQV
jgi:hypothetical protein